MSKIIYDLIVIQLAFRYSYFYRADYSNIIVVDIIISYVV